MAKLLFVDDDPAILRVFQRMFYKSPFQVDVASGGDAAMPLIERTDYDVIISDFEMPNMNGAELLAQACTKKPDSMRILVTGLTDFGAAVQAINRGEVFRLVRKPWNEDDLRFAVKLAVDTRQANLDRRHIEKLLAEKNEALANVNTDLRRLNRQLDAVVQERTNNLLDALINALDFRDTETLFHSKRVSAYAYRLGQELGLSIEDLSIVAQGALLHDIGKIGVPDAVLLKPGPLTEEEWALMKRHPALGAELLKSIDFLKEARDIVLHHQERFDGAGYPMGLKAAEIVVGARIFAVVDTFDAITSDRPYRKGKDYQAAMDEIARVSGTQLDPTVTAAFMRVPREEWNAIRDAVAQGATAASLFARQPLPSHPPVAEDEEFTASFR